jgi:hypothetical protein
MKNVYDMVSGEFIEDESVPMQEVDSSLEDDNFYHQSALQLQLVEQQTFSTTISLPADLALQTFLMSK